MYVTGFIGVDCYDLILYLSRTARYLNKRALIVDYSDGMALSYSIRNPLVPENEVIDYRGVDFVSFPESLDMIEDYDYVFIDLGFNKSDWVLENCDCVIFVTDLKLHNIERLKTINVFDDQDVSLVIRNIVNSKIKPKFVSSQFEYLNLTSDDIFTIEYSENNEAVAINAQYDSIFRFNRLTGDFKNFIKKFFEADFNSKVVQAAFKKASIAARR